MFERFVTIAIHLHSLRNYDTLYALLSGMQEISILRLGQTLALVTLSPILTNGWTRIQSLMDAKGGYANYRAAIRWDLAADRPVIPLL